MTARAPHDHTSDVRGVLAELGELVDDLGLDRPVEQVPAAEEQTAPRPKRPRKPRSRAAAADEAPVLRLVTESASAPSSAPQRVEDQDDAAAEPRGPDSDDAEDPGAGLLDATVAPDPNDFAELAELAADLAAPVVPLWESDTPEPLVPLWDAFAPELDVEPPRAWSLDAAMELVEPAAPPAPPPAPPRSAVLRALDRFRPRMFTLATAAAVLIAVAVVVFTHLDLGHTSGPITPVAGPAFEVTLMRTVDATGPATVAQAPTRSAFPPRTAQVYMDVAYRNAVRGDTLRLVIDLEPPAGSGGSPVQVGDQTHVLPAGGEIAVTIQGPSTGFAPGDYTVTAFHDGHLEQSVSFSIEPPAPTATPAPSATATAAAAPTATP